MLQRSLIAAAVAACLFTACDRSGNAMKASFITQVCPLSSERKMPAGTVPT